jgi:hypothetical protein
LEQLQENRPARVDLFDRGSLLFLFLAAMLGAIAIVWAGDVSGS